MSTIPFTNVRSLMAALSKAMNFIDPALESHHERTAYLAYFIAGEMGISDQLLNLTIYTAILHDIGFIGGDIVRKNHSSDECMKMYAKIGSDMLSDLPLMGSIARSIRYCHHPYSELKRIIAQNPEDQNAARVAAIVHLADFVVTQLREDVPVLNQAESICAAARDHREKRFMPEAVDALSRISRYEFIWMDLMHNPSFLLLFTGDILKLSLENTLKLTLLASRLIDYRSAFTCMHSAGVAASAYQLAKLSGMSEEECTKMAIAGNLHDIGKLSVPNSILEKPGKLTPKEYNIIKEHPYYTRLILLDVEGFETIRDWAGFHHEKLDGSGYPFHCGADRLDPGSRILAVADIFSALTEERPYRRGMDKEKTLDILYGNVKNGDIDGDVVALLRDHYDTVNTYRDQLSHIAGKRYFDTIHGEASIEA
ncbi:MAG: HD domain-containing protein [Eubacteriaceae bacterium]|nr:HD domain-containing protein [Eubacteriaceae bacterium]